MSTHTPPDWWVLQFEQNANAAMYVFYFLMMAPPEDTRRPPHFTFPVQQRQTCEPCAWFALSDILERLRINPQDLSLNYLATYYEIDIQEKYLNGMILLTKAWFTRSVDGNRLNWKNTTQNRLYLSNAADVFAAFVQSNRIKDDRIELYIDGVKRHDIGRDQRNTGLIMRACAEQIRDTHMHGLLNKIDMVDLKWNFRKRKRLGILCLETFTNDENAQRIQSRIGVAAMHWIFTFQRLTAVHLDRR